MGIREPLLSKYVPITPVKKSLVLKDAVVRTHSSDKRYGPMAVPSYYPQIVFGATQPSLLEKGQKALNEWAELSQNDGLNLPTITVLPEGTVSTNIAQYSPVSHQIDLNEELLAIYGMSLEEAVAHEGTHGFLATLRTRFKITNPTLFYQTAKQSIMDDIVRGDKRMILYATSKPGTEEAQRFLIERPYIPSQESRKALSEYIGWVIDQGEYDVVEGVAQLREKALDQMDPLLEKIQDYWSLFNMDDEGEQQAAGLAFRPVH